MMSAAVNYKSVRPRLGSIDVDSKEKLNHRVISCIFKVNDDLR